MQSSICIIIFSSEITRVILFYWGQLLAMKIHISQSTCDLLKVKEKYEITERGKVELKVILILLLVTFYNYWSTVLANVTHVSNQIKP